MTRTNCVFVGGMMFGALLCSPSLVLGQSLGAAQNFAILGGSQVTAAVGAAPSRIAGDVGVSPGIAITGFPPALGAIVVPPFVLHTPNDAASIAAQAAVTALFTDLSTTGGAATPIPDQLNGQNYGPGTYSMGAANLAGPGLLTLTGNGTYIFRIATTLTTIFPSNILLIGAQACNIWWQVGSSATINSATFAGNVIGFTGVNSMGPNAILEGRMLTRTPGEVTMAGDNIVNAAFCAAVPPPAAPGPGGGGGVGVAKSFIPFANGPGGISVLTITLTNTNATPATLTSALTDFFPVGVVIAATPNASTTCGAGVVTAPAGGNSISLAAGATIPGGAPGSCTLTANVTAASQGTYNNAIAVGDLVTTNGNNIVPAIATLSITGVIPPVPTLSEWAMIGLAALLCLCGFFAIRRRRLAD